MTNKEQAAKVASHMPIAHLKLIPLAERFSRLPNFLQGIILEAHEKIEIEEVVVFGSRARGDENPLSDWDLCFKFPDAKEAEWLDFVFALPETANTLLKIDAVNWNDIPPALKQSIEAEGLTVWKAT
jgi:predicted nucleotidyltransferase